MKAQTEKLLLTFRADIGEINLEADPLTRFNNATLLVARTLIELKKIIEDGPLSTDDEVHIFKLVKPEILSLTIYEGTRYNIMANQPIGTSGTQSEYFERELIVLSSFFNKHQFYYQYYKNNFSELDHLYFLRSSGPLPIPATDIPEPEAKYSTPVSNLFGRFRALESLQYFLVEQIDAIKMPGFAFPKSGNDPLVELKWTGEVINIVELAYGLWLTGQLNNGNASLNQIIRWLEQNLSVSLGIVHKKFIEISRRKRVSVTKFMDQMRDNIIQKVNESNA